MIGHPKWDEDPQGEGTRRNENAPTGSEKPTEHGPRVTEHSRSVKRLEQDQAGVTCEGSTLDDSDASGPQLANRNTEAIKSEIGRLMVVRSVRG